MSFQTTNDKLGENYQRLLILEPKLARRYAKMSVQAKQIASLGIERHYRACLKNDIDPDSEAIKEVLKSALHGRRAYC